MAIDEISQKCEDLCSHLDELDEAQRKNIVEHYFKHYLEAKTESDRKFVESVIELHEMGKDIEQIMFSLNMVYEEAEDECF